MKEQIYYERQFVPETSQCDINGVWRLGSLLEGLQNTANDHCGVFGIGRDDLILRGLCWVIVKLEIQIDRFPAAGEQVTIQTFTTESRFRFVPRYYTVQDAHRNTICKAGSLWMIMDKNTRKTLLPKDIGISFPDTSELKVPMTISMMKKKISGCEKSGTYQPQYTDFDINAHVNNIRYTDWLCNYLGMDVMHTNEISYITIDYNREILPGTDVDISLIRKENEFLFTGQVKENQAFSIFGRLRVK